MSTHPYASSVPYVTDNMERICESLKCFAESLYESVYPYEWCLCVLAAQVVCEVSPGTATQDLSERLMAVKTTVWPVILLVTPAM